MSRIILKAVVLWLVGVETLKGAGGKKRQVITFQIKGRSINKCFFCEKKDTCERDFPLRKKENEKQRRAMVIVLQLFRRAQMMKKTMMLWLSILLNMEKTWIMDSDVSYYTTNSWSYLILLRNCKTMLLNLGNEMWM